MCLVRSLWWCFFTDAFDLWKFFMLLLRWLFRKISILQGIPLCSVLNIRMGYSKTHGIPRKEHFFLRNNKNCSKPIPRNLSEHDFDGNPVPDVWKIKFHARYGCKKKNVQLSSLYTSWVWTFFINLFLSVLIFYISVMHGRNVSVFCLSSLWSVLCVLYSTMYRTAPTVNKYTSFFVHFN